MYVSCVCTICVCTVVYGKYGYNFQLIDQGRITNYSVLFSVILALLTLFAYFEVFFKDRELNLFKTGLPVLSYRLQKI